MHDCCTCYCCAGMRRQVLPCLLYAGHALQVIAPEQAHDYSLPGVVQGVGKDAKRAMELHVLQHSDTCKGAARIWKVQNGWAEALAWQHGYRCLSDSAHTRMQGCTLSADQGDTKGPVQMHDRE